MKSVVRILIKTKKDRGSPFTQIQFNSPFIIVVKKKSMKWLMETSFLQKKKEEENSSIRNIFSDPCVMKYKPRVYIIP